MEGIDLENKDEVNLIEKISTEILLKSLFPFFNNESKYIFPLLLSSANPLFISSIRNGAENILKNEETKKSTKIAINNLLVSVHFFKNCKIVYKEYLKNFDIIKNKDPIAEMFNKAEKETENINDYGLNHKKYFYNFLLNVPFINISPCGSLMNIIYFNEYYRNIKENKKKPKIRNVILLIKDEIAKCRINDLFGEIIFNQKNFVIKNKNISFNCQLFMNAISNIYRVFDQPLRIIVDGGEKNIKQNFKKNEYIMENILYKLVFKSNSLLIIHRV